MLGEQRLQTTREMALTCRLPGNTVDLDGLAKAPHEGQLVQLGDYHGEMLAGFNLPDAPGFMAWLDRQRMAVHAQVVACRERLHAQAQTTRQIGLRVALARAQARVDPWREAPHLRLMQALADAGRKAQALAHWDQVRETFQRELDAQPGESLRALAQRLQALATQSDTPDRPDRPDRPEAPTKPRRPRTDAADEPSVGRGVGPSTDAAALLHTECRALDPRDVTALGVIETVHQALAAGAHAHGGRLRRAGGTSLLLRFDGRSGRHGPCVRALRVALKAQETWRAHPASDRLALPDWPQLSVGPLAPDAAQLLARHVLQRQGQVQPEAATACSTSPSAMSCSTPGWQGARHRHLQAPWVLPLARRPARACGKALIHLVFQLVDLSTISS